MYTSFYNLELKPFQINSDPAFLWTGEKHKEALATLKYGILNNKGFLLLTGDVGTGKTTLINALIQSLDDDIVCTSVPDPNLKYIDFINYIAFAFGIETVFKTKGHFVIEFKKFLLNAYQEGKKVLLIIDESQLLTDELLEQIRLLSNIELADTKLLNIFFVGQNEFNDILSKKKNRAVRQRLTLNYNIDPLTLKETDEYIKYRLKVAGTTKKIFSRGAVQKIHLHSQGFPRRINILCDHCLLSGYVNEKNKINVSIVNECAEELRIPLEVKPNKSSLFFGPVLSKKVPKQPETSTKIRGSLLMIFTFLLCTAATIFLYQHPSVIKQGIQIINNTKSSLETKSDNPSNQPDHQEKTEKVEAVKILETVRKTEVQKNTQEPIKEQPEAQLKKQPQEQLQEQAQEQPDDKPFESQMLPKAALAKIVTDEEILPPLETIKIIISFKHNSNNITADGMVEINKFADTLLKYPHIRVIIKGYSDSIGNPEYNKKLSKFRANIVKSFLMGKGVKPEQIIEKGLGSENPIESNDTSFGRRMNRRVEVEVYKNGY